ncbi:hypothetical protein [Flavobacterium chilense]|nr:hypothetical protein [Flavobacterium chilense]
MFFFRALLTKAISKVEVEKSLSLEAVCIGGTKIGSAPSLRVALPR